MRSKNESGIWIGGLGEEVDDLLNILDVNPLAIAEILEVNTRKAAPVLEAS